jgi:CheY-like chemotaxis protein
MTKAKILIIEDERIIAEDIRRNLESTGYITSAIVSSGEEALRKAEKLKPDLVLMNIFLEDEKAGIEAAAKIH